MRLSMFRWFVVILVLKTGASQNDEISRWAYGLRTLLKECPTATATATPLGNPDNPDVLGALRHCLQHRAILAVDNLLTEDVIPILDGINFVRYQNYRFNTTGQEFDSEWRDDIGDKETPGNDKGWQGIVANRLIRLFRTHVLKVDLDQVSKATLFSVSETGENIRDNFSMQGRRRHHRRKGILPIAMMGFLFMGTILIPMGFQFLAVLGGKALILAKMALMLSSIQGLKKIATSGVNYGLYHSPVSEQSWHERSNDRETATPIELRDQNYSRG